MKVVSHGLEVIHEAGKYTCAGVEYTGLVSYGILKMGGRLVTWSFLKVATPVVRGIAVPFVTLRNAARRLATGRKDYLDEKFRGVEDQLTRIEEKLTTLENRGIVLREAALPCEAPRKIDMGRQGLLRQIVEANKSLMDA